MWRFLGNVGVCKDWLDFGKQGPAECSTFPVGMLQMMLRVRIMDLRKDAHSATDVKGLGNPSLSLDRRRKWCVSKFRNGNVMTRS